MGIISINITGSFMERPTKRFSAMYGGHALAVAEAIQWLADDVLPKAIQQDHMLHETKAYPELGYGVKE